MFEFSESMKGAAKGERPTYIWVTIVACEVYFTSISSDDLTNIGENKGQGICGRRRSRKLLVEDDGRLERGSI